MDNITLIRVISGVLFFVLLFVLIQRRKRRMGGAQAYISGSTVPRNARVQRNRVS